MEYPLNMSKRNLVVIPPAGREQLKALNPEQAEYLEFIKTHEQVFAIGRAGTGKTYVPTAYAADELIARRLKNLILVRPAVDAGESLGYLPGDLEEKMAPWVRPFIDVLEERLGKPNTADMLVRGTIRVEPFQHMRGRTFNDALIILDEAQNTTPEQMQLFLTRIGLNTKVIVTGDLKQTDLRKGNGLSHALRLNEQFNIAPVVTLIQVERSGLAGKWADAYEEGA